MKFAALLLTTLTLTGCLSMESLKPDTSKDTSFYRLDANSRMFCRGETNLCQDLTLIASSHRLQQVEEAYGSTIETNNTVRGLMKLVLQPADQAYTAEPLAGLQYQYKLPITERTTQLWNLLKQAQIDHYGSNNAL